MITATLSLTISQHLLIAARELTDAGQAEFDEDEPTPVKKGRAAK